MKCAYSKCFCEEKSLDDEDVVKVNKRRYHSQCYCVSEDIKTIKKLFHDAFNNNVVYAQLMRTINSIVFDKGVTTEFLLFGMNYYIEHKMKVNYPGGLYYVIQNKDVKNAFEKMKANNIKNTINVSVNSDMDLSETFDYKKGKTRTIGDIFDE